MIYLDFEKRFDDFLLSINAEIPAKGITAIFGRSGAGKTSLINAISGIVKPDTGQIKINQHCVFDSKTKTHQAIHLRKIGYVFQESRLFPHYKVQGNLLYGSRLKPTSQRFKEIVDLLDLSHLLKRMPSELSGGEKQRCAIARALLSQPDMLLMDEPLASLDLPRKQEIMPYLERLASDIDCPILYVTHSIDEMLHLADHILLLEQGRVKAFGPLEAIWQSNLLEDWQSQAPKSSLILGRLSQHHSQYALSQLEIAPDVHLWMSKVNQSIGQVLRLRVYASDISITLTKVNDTSIRNILPVMINTVQKPMQGKGQVLLNLSIISDGKATDIHLWAQITHWAFDELHLSEGQQVFAQIKSVSMTNQDTAGKPTHK